MLRRMARRSAAALTGATALLAAGLVSRSDAKPTPPRDMPELATPETPASQVERDAILVVLDGARWQDVVGEASVMPQLAELARAHGAALGGPRSGSVVRASGPNFVSMPGYAEIFGGAPARGCPGNDDCAAATQPTIADDVRAWTGSPDDAAVFASWPDLVRVSSQHPEQLAVSAGRSLVHGDGRMRRDAAMSELLDRGARADAWPGEKDFRPDRFTAPLAERYLEVVRPRFLFLSLGESDEYAHQGNRDGYVRALRYDDDVIAELYRATHGEGARGRRTTIFVTADHGRAYDFRDHGGRWPESARSWLVVLGDEPDAARLTGDYTLSDIAPTVEAWLGVPDDEATAGPRAGAVIAGLL